MISVVGAHVCSHVQAILKHVVPLLSKQVSCKVRQSVPWGPSLHLLPTQVLHHVTGHHPNSDFIARKNGWVRQASERLWMAASHAVLRQGGLREDSMVMYVPSGGYKHHLAMGASPIQEAVYLCNDLSQT